MKHRKLSEQEWYNGAVIACIGVAFYVLLTHLRPMMTMLGTFIGYFEPVILAIVFAYILNPLAKIFYYRVFRKLKLGKTRWSLSVALTFVTALLLLFLLMGMLIPQLIESVVLFSHNFEDYAQTLSSWLEGGPVSIVIDSGELQTASENAMSTISAFLKDNTGDILNALANSGKGILTTVIALILAIYLLIDKKKVLIGVSRLIGVLFRRETSENIIDFFLHCDVILVNYIGQSLVDALIIGSVNAIFMLICGMQYIGLVSVVVGVTNLVPNFGPAIGGVIGAFVLLLVNPWHALMFIAFCVVLQTMDAYVIKPRLFSNSLGVSGLLMLVAGIVLGKMFGVLGVLLSVPAAAILSFIYSDYFLPRQEKRRQAQDSV